MTSYNTFGDGDQSATSSTGLLGTSSSQLETGALLSPDNNYGLPDETPQQRAKRDKQRLAAFIAGISYGVAGVIGVLLSVADPASFAQDGKIVYLLYGCGFILLGMVVCYALKTRSTNLINYCQWASLFSLITTFVLTLTEALLLHFSVTKGFLCNLHSSGCEATAIIVVIIVGTFFFAVAIFGYLGMRPLWIYYSQVKTIGGRTALRNLKHVEKPLMNAVLNIDSDERALEDIVSKMSIGKQAPPDPMKALATRFNKKPEAGIAYGREQQLIGPEETDIARFLYHGHPSLKMDKIGDYIAEPKNTGVLKAFVEYFDFSNLSLDNALRLYLSKFRLPGEAQKIDRLMEAFAQRFCHFNPGIFPNPDTAYVLSFSLIMLNTDAHNPAIKKKMTKAGFVSNNRGIADGKDLPLAYLEELYDSLVKNEIKMKDSDSLWAGAVQKGWLLKMANNAVGNWQKRWFLVSNNCLYYFNTPDDKDPRVIIPLEGLGVRPFTEYRNKYCFEIFNPSRQKIKSVKLGTGTGPSEGTHDKFIFAVIDDKRSDEAKTQELEAWIEAVSANIVANPIITLLNLKKERFEKARQQNPSSPSSASTSARPSMDRQSMDQNRTSFQGERQPSTPMLNAQAQLQPQSYFPPSTFPAPNSPQQQQFQQQMQQQFQQQLQPQYHNPFLQQQPQFQQQFPQSPSQQHFQSDQQPSQYSSTSMSQFGEF